MEMIPRYHECTEQYTYEEDKDRGIHSIEDTAHQKNDEKRKKLRQQVQMNCRGSKDEKERRRKYRNGHRKALNRSLIGEELTSRREVL